MPYHVLCRDVITLVWLDMDAFSDTDRTLCSQSNLIRILWFNPHCYFLTLINHQWVPFLQQLHYTRSCNNTSSYTWHTEAICDIHSVSNRWLSWWLILASNNCTKVIGLCVLLYSTIKLQTGYCTATWQRQVHKWSYYQPTMATCFKDHSTLNHTYYPTYESREKRQYVVISFIP